MQRYKLSCKVNPHSPKLKKGNGMQVTRKHVNQESLMIVTCELAITTRFKLYTFLLCSGPQQTDLLRNRGSVEVSVFVLLFTNSYTHPPPPTPHTSFLSCWAVLLYVPMLSWPLVTASFHDFLWVGSSDVGGIIFYQYSGHFNIDKIHILIC